ncbi:MAG: methylmalonyl Co-A mutase-associated GTPase MeaB [Bacteroidota bacterium]
MSTLFSYQPDKSDFRALARCISLVENAADGYETFLRQLPSSSLQNIIGITGPPGAGKSTLTDALIGELTASGKSVAVLCIDPSSPFHLGALLGDRIRMSSWYSHPNVYIRSLASRGSMGGLHPRIIEVTEVLKAAGFDWIIIETVGVGQSEIEIAGLADITTVVLVPESGDEIQTMKAGLMEIADVFVVNKSDRPGADAFVSNLRLMLAPAFSEKEREIPIVKTNAASKEGVGALKDILIHMEHQVNKDRKAALMAEKAYQLIRNKRMEDLDKNDLKDSILRETGAFNLFQFIQKWV